MEKLDEPHLALERICAVCRAHKLLPVAVRGGPDPVKQSAWALGLGWFPPQEASRPRPLESVADAAAADAAPADEVALEAPADAAPEATDEVLPVATARGRIYRGTVRSGQQVTAPEGDLVVIGAVNAGAEVLAAGNVHVYGALRGRALAGIHGDVKAGIFCRELHAELLSVAGNYKRLEDIDPRLLGTTVQVQLFDGQLSIKSLD